MNSVGVPLDQVPAAGVLEAVPQLPAHRQGHPAASKSGFQDGNIRSPVFPGGRHAREQNHASDQKESIQSSTFVPAASRLGGKPNTARHIVDGMQKSIELTSPATTKRAAPRAYPTVVAPM